MTAKWTSVAMKAAKLRGSKDNSGEGAGVKLRSGPPSPREAMRQEDKEWPPSSYSISRLPEKKSEL